MKEAWSENREESAKAASEERLFTQAEVDRVIGERLGRERRDFAAKLEGARRESFDAGQRQGIEDARAEAMARDSEREAGLDRREREIERREMRAEAEASFRERGLSEKLADCLDYGSKEAFERTFALVEGVVREAVGAGVAERVGGAMGGLPRADAGSPGALMAQVRGVMGLK